MKRADRREPDLQTRWICERLHARRLELELRIEDVAARAGLSTSYVSDIEGGYRDPGLATLEALAEALSIPLGEVFGPTRPLSDAAIEAGAAFDRVPDSLKIATLAIIASLAAAHPRTEPAELDPPSS